MTCKNSKRFRKESSSRGSSILGLIVSPNQDQRLRDIPNPRVLGNNEQDTGARTAVSDEFRKPTRHCTLIVAY
jgi:hypothetical protein